jgi:hypothetical protein
MEAGASNLPRGGAARATGLALGAGLFLGLLAGLLAGWLVWPVRWHDTDPADLRLEHQIDYVLATADALTISGDVNAAERRLRALTDDDTTWPQVANLVMRVAVAEDEAGRRAAGDRVRLLFDTLAMPSPLEEEFATAQAGATRGMWVAAGALALGGLTCLALLATGTGRKAPTAEPLRALLGLIGAALVALLKRLLARRPAPRTPAEILHGGARPAAAPAVAYEDAEGGGYAEDAGEYAEDAGEYAEDAGGYAEEGGGYAEDAGEYAEDAGGYAEDAGEYAEEAGGYAEDAGEYAEDEDQYAEIQALPLAGASGAAGPADRSDEYPLALGVFEAEYHHGDRDFDCSFSIEDDEAVFLGECGVGVADVLDAAGASAVQAFEVWLFDKNDIRTVSTILVSEYAYQHDDVSAELGAKGELEQAQPGLVLTLETMNLVMTATVTAMSYVRGGPGPNSAFASLNVELVVEPAEAG